MIKNNCAFCHMPSARIVLQNDWAFAVKDGYPVVSGHSLVIVKRHIISFFDATRDELAALFSLLCELRKSFPENQDCNIAINDGLNAGQTVPHLHIHFIPRNAGDCKDPRGGIRRIFPEKMAWWKE